MKNIFSNITLLLLVVFIAGCKKNDASAEAKTSTKNSVKYAEGLSIAKYDGYSIVRVSNPWPKANQVFTYILKEKNGLVPDSLKQFETISVPVQKIIVTSTTHIPSLEMLGVENSLVGFPNLDYISSEKMRALIDAGKVRELGSNQALNTEITIDLQPDVIVGHGIDNNNPIFENLQKSGLKTMFNGDWNEQTPLGKAEWIKFFGALYGKEKQADAIFTTIEKDYHQALDMAKKATAKPTVLAGAMYENQWYLPQGNSWGALLVKDGGGNYLWSDTQGTGSLSLPFETVLEKAKTAEFWIGPAQFTSLSEMEKANPHYTQFDAFKNKKVYSFSIKKGKTGGVVYYELSSNRPDLVLKDVLKILHPELLPEYELFFFEKLK